MAKYNIYAVAIGKDPATGLQVTNLKFKSWSECKPYINNVEGARYKGFLTESEADIWIEKILNKTPAPAVNADANSCVMMDSFVNACTLMNVNPEQMLAFLQKQYTEQVQFTLARTIKPEEKED